MSNAVIIIPGIKGSQLINVNTHNFHSIWRDFRFNFNNVEDLELTDEFEGNRYEEKMDVLIERGSTESLAYKEFIDDLEVNVPKFIFSYDWRKSNRENGRNLHDFIEMLKKKSKASSSATDIKKVSIVTHSMGNHILRFYIKDVGFSSIDKIVFVAPPFMGALAMINGLIKGQGIFKNIKRKLREVVRTFPGAIELIPRYKDAALFKDGTSVDFFNRDHWQEGITKPLSGNNPYQKRLAEKFVKNLAQAKVDVSDLDTWMDELSDAEKKRILVIVRDEIKTDQAMRVDENDKNAVNIDGATATKHGDSVVPHASSCIYHNEILTLAITNSFKYDDDSHAFVMKEERVQDLVGWFFGSDTFDYRIPGNSIKVVTGLHRNQDKTNHLWHYEITKE